MDEVCSTASDKAGTVSNGSTVSPSVIESDSSSPQSRSEASQNVESRNSRTVSDSSIENRRKSIIRDPSRKPGTTNKTVSFGSLPTELTVRSAKDCLKHMYTGGQLVKVRSASRVYRRFYWLDEEKGELRWEPSKKDSDKARVRLTDIHEVRSGKNSEVFLSVDAAEHFPNECAFSIVYGEEYITLDLVASTTEEANIWCTGLRHLISGLATSASPGDTAREAREKWLSDMFSAADVNSDGFMDENESIQLIKSLSDGVRDNVIKTKLREYLKSIKTDRENDQPVGLTQSHFIELFKDVATRAEVYFILVRYASHEDAMSVDDLRSFLEIEQGINASPEMCLSIVAECEPSAQLREKSMLGIDGFTRYLTCDKCALFNPKKRLPTQEMNRPFSHYFISASHNTYLIQDQLSGRTSLSCFQTVLEKGCRCLSFDVWSFVDNNNEKNLMVHHPRNNRQQVRLQLSAVLSIIHEHAFSSSDFPLILVIRVRATESGQLHLAEQLQEYLGNSLCTAEQFNTTVANLTPEKLKHKILLELSGRSQDDLNLSATQVRETPLIQRLAKMCFFKTEIVTGIPQKKTEVELSVMPETVASRVATNNAEALVEAGSTQLIRVEPNDSRVDCSNYNPLDVWNMGVQMAALHFQTPGLMMDLNEGMFAANGGCGYALKPSIMIDSERTIRSEVTTLHLRVISGTDLPKPRGAGSKGSVIDPYVLIEVFGAATDCAEHRTRTVHNCGRNPVFDESCEFRLTVPDMALIRFVILDDDFIGDEFIGQYTIAHSCLLPGYRVAKLSGIFGEDLNGASLLVHVAISSSRETKQKKTVLRRRPNKPMSKLRTVGFKSADELYKSISQSAREAADLRQLHENCTKEFKEAAGLQPVSNVKQVMKHLSGRKMPIKFRMIDNILTMRLDGGQLPEHGRKSAQSTDALVNTNRKLTITGPVLLVKMEAALTQATELSETIESLGSVDGLKSKKASKVHENHAWNCRLLRGQIELLRTAIEVAATQLIQIVECAIQYDMVQGELPDAWREIILNPSPNDQFNDKKLGQRYNTNKFSLRGLHRTLSADSTALGRSLLPKSLKRSSKSSVQDSTS